MATSAEIVIGVPTVPVRTGALVITALLCVAVVLGAVTRVATVVVDAVWIVLDEILTGTEWVLKV